MRIHPIILGLGVIASILWALDAPMVREIQGVVMSCDPDGFFGDGCQRDLGGMALRLAAGTAVTLVLAMTGGFLLGKKAE